MEKEVRYLKYAYTDSEKKEMAGRLSRATIEAREAGDELKAVQAQFKSRIESAKNQANDLAQKIEQGYEFRNIDCRIKRDYAHGKICIYRLDTDEMIESRDMTVKERQIPIGEDCTMEFAGGGEMEEI